MTISIKLYIIMEETCFFFRYLKCKVLLISIFVLMAAIVCFCIEAEFSDAGYQGLNIGGEQAVNPFQSDNYSSNDVNTYSGNVEFSINLVSLLGPNGFDLNLGMRYSSEIEDMVYQDNDNTQTSWVGAGWSLEMPAIIADLNGTVDFSDDKYYYFSVDDGTIPLIPVSATGDPEEYYLSEYKPWKIKRYFGSEEDNVQYVIGWEITREDGSVMVLGDFLDPNYHSGCDAFDATRIAVGLENSILTLKTLGPYYGSYDVREVPYRWDLKTLKSTDRQNEITISYDQQQQIAYDYNAPSTHVCYTCCSHPDTIYDSMDRKIVFHFNDRNVNECYTKNPATAFLRYDSKYLDSLQIIGCIGDTIGTYSFTYELSHKNYNYPFDLKRYLTEISYYTFEDSTIPSMKFEYNIGHIKSEYKLDSGLYGEYDSGEDTVTVSGYSLSNQPELIDSYLDSAATSSGENVIWESYGFDLGESEVVSKIQLFDNADTVTQEDDYNVIVLYGNNNSDWTIHEDVNLYAGSREDGTWNISIQNPVSARYWRVYLMDTLQIDSEPVEITEIKAFYREPLDDDVYFGALKSIRYPSGTKVKYAYAKRTLDYAIIDTIYTNLYCAPGDYDLRLNSSDTFILRKGSSCLELIVDYWDGYWHRQTFSNVDPYSWSCAGNSFIFSTWSVNDGDHNVHLYELKNGELQNTYTFECLPDSTDKSLVQTWAGQDCYYVLVESDHSSPHFTGSHNSYFIVKHNGTWIKKYCPEFDLGYHDEDIVDNHEPVFKIFPGKDFFVRNLYMAELDNYGEILVNPACKERILSVWKWDSNPNSCGIVTEISDNKNMDMAFYCKTSDDYFVLCVGPHDDDVCDGGRGDWTEKIILYLWDYNSSQWDSSQVCYLEDFNRWDEAGAPHCGLIWLTTQRDFFAYATDTRPVNSDDNENFAECKIYRIYRNRTSCCDTTNGMEYYNHGHRVNVASGIDNIAVIDGPRDHLILWEWTEGGVWNSTVIDLNIDALDVDDDIYIWPSNDHFCYSIPTSYTSDDYKTYIVYEENSINGHSEWISKRAFDHITDEPTKGHYNSFTNSKGYTFRQHYGPDDTVSVWGEGFLTKGYESDNPLDIIDDDTNLDIKYFLNSDTVASMDEFTFNYLDDNIYFEAQRIFDGDAIDSLAYDYLRKQYKYNFGDDDYYHKAIDYPCTSKTIYAIDDDDITGTTWYYHYYDGTIDASAKRAKYHKSVVELPGSRGFIEQYHYCGLSSSVFNNTEFPDLTDEDLGYGWVLDGVPYKSYTRNADSVIIDSTHNYVICKVPYCLDSLDYPTISYTYIDSAYSWIDGVGMWTRIEYDTYNCQANKIQQFYKSDQCKTTEITFAYDADGAVYDSMEARNMLVQEYQVDVYDEDVRTQTSQLLRSMKTVWSEFLTPSRCFYPCTTYNWLDTDASWIRQNVVLSYDEFGNVLVSEDALGIKTSYLYDAAGIYSTAKFENAEPEYVMYPSLVEYCSTNMLGNTVELEGDIDVVWPDYYKEKGVNPWEDDYGYFDPPEDGLTLTGSTGGYMQICHPDVDSIEFEGEYILRFDYRILEGDICATVGSSDSLSTPGITFYATDYLDGRWHTAFAKGSWEEENSIDIIDLLCIRVTCMETPTTFQIDNIAFYPADSKASTQKVNYEKDKFIVETDDNGFSKRNVYDKYIRIITSTDQYREYPSSNSMFYMRESETIDSFDSLEAYPNYTLSTSYPNKNLLVNSSFEHGLFCWNSYYAYDGVGFTTELYRDVENCSECEYPAMGDHVFKIASLGRSSNYFWQETRTGIIEGNANYTLSLKAWCPADQIDDFIRVRIYWYDKEGTNIGFDVFSELFGVQGASSLYEFSVVAPDTAVSARVSILPVSQSIDYYDEYYFDQIEFIKASEYTPSVVEIKYSDGLNNELQTVNTYSMINAPDYVTAKEYDDLFRVSKAYKPYEAVQIGHRYNPHNDDSADAYYDSSDPYFDPYLPDCGGIPYTSYNYTNDPRGRLESVYLPGADFVDYPTTYEYGYNTSSVNGYSSNELFKFKSIDADTLINVMYVNVLGDTIETTVDSVSSGLNLTTRYDVNAVGEVLKITPPLACSLMDANNSDYQHLEILKTYDTFGRIVSDSSSDYGLIEYIYNAIGQVRFSQNSRQRSTDTWTETIYDQFGRETIIGEISIAEPDIETEYLSSSSSGEVLRFEYDSYGAELYHPPYEYPTPTSIDTDTLHVRGKLVGYDNGGNNSDCASVKKSFTYGNRGELLCASTYIEGLEAIYKEIYYDYDLSGKVIKQTYPVDVGGEDPLLVLTYNYDTRGRLVSINHYIDGQGEQTLSSYEYFIDGAVKNYILGNNVQKIDYYYNPQGFLEEINGTGGEDGIFTPDATDKFSMRLGYEEDYEIAEDDGSFKPKFTGTPSWAVYHYQTANGSDSIGYTFYYDKAKRLTEAKFAVKDNTSDWAFNSIKDDMEFVYDANSKILSQVRYFTGDADYTTMTYNYNDTLLSNKLDYISPLQSSNNYSYDEVGNCTGDDYRGGSEYSYNWRNLMDGASWSGDEHSDIDELLFAYDNENKRVKKTLNYILCDEEYCCDINPSTSHCTYSDSCTDTTCCAHIPGDANGDGLLLGGDVTYLTYYFRGLNPAPEPLMKVDVNCDGAVLGGDVTVLTNYFRGLANLKCCYWLCPDSTSTYYIHSEGNEIVQFTEGGSACDNECYVYGPNGRVASFINGEGPYYYLADHLNSTRAVLNNTGSVVSTHYYLPYGDASPNYGGETALDISYKFSGKELDDEGADRIAGFNLYYFGARNYDPLSCMWKQVDPMASKYPGLSPYNYCADNPVSNYDPDGNDYSFANNYLTWSFKRSLNNYWNNMVNSWQEFNAGMGRGAYGTAKSSVVGLGGFLADASTKSMAEIGCQYGIGIHYGITHASEIWDQYSADISNTWNSGARGKGELIGRFGTEIGLTILTTKGIGALSKTAFSIRGQGIILRGAKNPKVAIALVRGRNIHKAYKANLHNPAKGLYKEFTGIKGIRPDFVDFNKRIIYELKPNNPYQIKAGLKQLQKYKNLFEKQYGGSWNTMLDTY